MTVSAKTVLNGTFGISRNTHTINFEILKPLQFSCAVI